jgi:hypothetical protein
MSREERETQLKDILKNDGLEAILVIYSQVMGIPLGTTLSADLNRFTIIGEILDHEYPPTK